MFIWRGAVLQQFCPAAHRNRRVGRHEQNKHGQPSAFQPRLVLNIVVQVERGFFFSIPAMF